MLFRILVALVLPIAASAQTPFVGARDVIQARQTQSDPVCQSVNTAVYLIWQTKPTPPPLIKNEQLPSDCSTSATFTGNKASAYSSYKSEEAVWFAPHSAELFSLVKQCSDLAMYSTYFTCITAVGGGAGVGPAPTTAAPTGTQAGSPGATSSSKNAVARETALYVAGIAVAGAAGAALAL